MVQRRYGILHLPHGARAAPAHRGRLIPTSLVALGIVFGDIGTSPLYAMRESFHGHTLAPTPGNVLGVLSLISWSLLIVVSLKYLVLLLRADNQGEGGILALAALVTRSVGERGRGVVALLGLVGAALLYGDGMVTPAISVVSAMEGLTVAAPAFGPFVVPLTVAALVLLFTIQRGGTTRVGRVFGPVMLLWFATLASLGAVQVAQEPTVMAALDPRHALGFVAQHGWGALLVIGSVFLVVTGSEALYADMGHFGRGPIRLPWFAVALPALLLNYWGQGALLYGDPTAASNPFFLLAPPWALYPLVLLAAAATLIASQALISGVFSLTRQAVQLGYVPRLTVRHTSGAEIGQVYVPAANWALMVASCLLVVAFGDSAGLAAAYGVAVSTSMVATTLLLAAVMVLRWGWRRPLVALVAGAFLTIDLLFLTGNAAKVPEGGWVPLVVGAVVFLLMATWKQGRSVVAERLHDDEVTTRDLLERVRRDPPVRVPGVAVFMSSNPFLAPPALLHNLAHNKVLHERVLLLAVKTEGVPRVGAVRRREVLELGEGIFQAALHYGFMQSPNVPRDLRNFRMGGEALGEADVTYFLGRETVLPRTGKRMALWRERLFAFMARNAQPATAFFGLPPGQVMEIGTQVEI